MLLPGKYSLIHSVEYKFLQPVYCSDQLSVSGTVIEKDDRFKLLTIRVEIRNKKGEKVCKGLMKVGVIDGES
jgi:acyl dehydratase